MSDMKIEQIDYVEPTLGKRNRESYEENVVNASASKKHKTERVSSSSQVVRKDLSVTPSLFALESHVLKERPAQIICSYRMPDEKGPNTLEDLTDVVGMHENVDNNYDYLVKNMTPCESRPIITRWLFKWLLYEEKGTINISYSKHFTDEVIEGVLEVLRLSKRLETPIEPEKTGITDTPRYSGVGPTFSLKFEQIEKKSGELILKPCNFDRGFFWITVKPSNRDELGECLFNVHVQKIRSRLDDIGYLEAFERVMVCDLCIFLRRMSLTECFGCIRVIG